jgi:hypothetical protein
MGHALLFAARPESFEPGLFFQISMRFRTFCLSRGWAE